MRPMPRFANRISSRIWASLNVFFSPVPWSSMNSPLPVMTTFMSTSAVLSSM